MSVLKGTIDTYSISVNQEIDLSNTTFIYLKNNSAVKVTINGSLTLNSGATEKIEFGFVVSKQRWEVLFENIIGNKELFVMIGRASSKCSCK